MALLRIIPLTILALLFFFKISIAQTEYKDQASGNSSVDLIYGVQRIVKDTLDSFLLGLDSSMHFERFQNVIGISLARSVDMGDASQDVFFSLQYHLPQGGTGVDSVSYSFTGYQIGLAFGGKDFFYLNPQLDVVYALGVQLGGYYFKRTDKALDLITAHMKNGIIAPQVLLETRYLLGPLKIGLKMRAQYDISNTNWKHIVPTGTNMGGFSARGFALIGTLGYKID